MSFWDVLFVAEYGGASADEAIGDAPSAVDVAVFHDDAVLYLSVHYGGVWSPMLV